MKKLLSTALVLSAITASMLLSSAAAVVEKDAGYVSVNASSTKEIAPNQAEITVNIETSDKSFQKASAENKVIADKVYSSLKALLNTENGDYVKTGNYSATPVYIYTKENKKVFDKYVVKNNVVVRTQNTELVSKIIDTAIAQGATEVNDLQFLVADYDSACSELLAGLAQKAYMQANIVAASIGQRIAGTKSINLTCNPDGGSRPRYMMRAKLSMDNASVNTPIESGKIKIFANVDASFYVK